MFLIVQVPDDRAVQEALQLLGIGGVYIPNGVFWALIANMGILAITGITLSCAAVVRCCRKKRRRVSPPEQEKLLLSDASD